MRPEVAALFELTMGVTKVHVPKLGRDYDLTTISVEQAEQLVAAGCDRLRRKQVPENNAGLEAATTRPARAKRKKRTM
jgi:hypothetical protein